MTICSIALISSQAFSLKNFRGPLIRALVTEGITVYALAPDYDDTTWKAVRALGATPVRFRLSRAGLNPVNDLLGMLDLVRILRRIRPDATLSYFIKPVIYGSLAARLAGISKRYSLIAGLGYVFTSRWQKPGLRRRLLRWGVSGLYRLALKGTDRVFFQNRDDINTLLSSGIVDTTQATLTPGTGVELSYYTPARLPDGNIAFLLIARLLKEKGIYQYIEAARRVKAHYPDCRFLLVGGVDPNPGSITEAEVRAWVEEGLIEWPGVVADVRPWIAEASVYVLPSYYREGVPRSNQEAMAMGRPVITTDWVGCRETVEHKVNGFLVPVRNAVALADAMMRFVTEPGLISSMGRASRIKAERQFDVHRINDQILTEMGIKPLSAHRQTSITPMTEGTS